MKNPFSWLKTHKLLGGCLILVVSGVVYNVVKPETPPTYITETVAKQTLFQTVDASSEIRSEQKRELAFQTSGRIESLFVREGDAVSVGQPLAQLDLAGLFPELTQTLQNGYDVLTDAVMGTPGTPSAITSAETAAESARITLELAITDYENAKQVHDASIAEAETTLAVAKQDLLDLDRTLAAAANEIQQDFAGILQSATIAVRTTLANADTVLGVTNTLANDDLEDVLSLTDEQRLVSAKNAYTKAFDHLRRSESSVFALSSTSSYATIDPLITDVATLLSETSQALLYTHQALDATIIDTQAFSFTDLQTKKASIDTDRDTIRTQQTTLETQSQLRESTRVSQDKQRTAATLAVEKASRALDTTKAIQDQTLAAAKAKKETAAASLQQQLATSAQTIGSTNGQLRNAEILSPLNGIVTDITLEQGEFATAGNPILTVQSIDANAFELIADVSESDVSKVVVGQPADIEIDAYGSNVTFPAQVVLINPAEKLVDGVVFYEVTLLFTTPDALPTLKPGMTATATILIDTLSDVLSLPQRSIHYHDEAPYVLRLNEDGTTTSEVSVTLGRRSDGGRVEVTEGLKEGDVIVVTSTP